MAKKEQFQDPGAQKQRPLEESRKKTEQNGPFGKQPNEVAQEANRKRQQKQMHKQDNK